MANNKNAKNIMGDAYEWKDWKSLSQEQREYAMHQILRKLTNDMVEIRNCVEKQRPIKNFWSILGGAIGGGLVMAPVAYYFFMALRNSPF